uniref:CCHC-type domain-containing protein n=1 Tax=Pygocentrus nattereri TaxID=42514 RepID=A0A3B4D6I7_PYGNA
ANFEQNLKTLVRYLSEQQSQLTQLVASIKGLSSQLHTLNLAEPELDKATPMAPVSSSLVTFPVSKPNKFKGNPDKCRGFLLQCSLFFDNFPASTDQARISFIVSRLSEKALEWATASWDHIHRMTYLQFLKEFKAVFDHPYEGKLSGELLAKLRQGNRSVVEYSLEFRILAASSGWNEAALLVIFRQGLNPDLLNELACEDDDLSLDQLINLAIKLDHLLRHQTRVKLERKFKRVLSASKVAPENPEPTEPMQCDSSCLSPEERLRRMKNSLCLYCGEPGHWIRECTKRKSLEQGFICPSTSPISSSFFFFFIKKMEGYTRA